MKSDKIEVKMTDVQKNIIRKLSQEQNISMSDYVMRALFLKLDSDGRLLNFLNNEDF